MSAWTGDYALTLHQPWASLVVVGVKDVENRSWTAPATLPQWGRCTSCKVRVPPHERLGGRHPVEGGRCGTVTDDYDTPWGERAFPLRLWIHAGQQWDDSDRAAEGLAVWRRREELARRKNLRMRDFRAEALRSGGALVGWVLLTGCHHAYDHAWARVSPAAELGRCSRWAEPDAYHWTLTDAHRLDQPVPMRGRQRLWQLPSDLAAGRAWQVLGPRDLGGLSTWLESTGQAPPMVTPDRVLRVGR